MWFGRSQEKIRVPAWEKHSLALGMIKLWWNRSRNASLDAHDSIKEHEDKKFKTAILHNSMKLDSLLTDEFKKRRVDGSLKELTSVFLNPSQYCFSYFLFFSMKFSDTHYTRRVIGFGTQSSQWHQDFRYKLNTQRDELAHIETGSNTKDRYFHEEFQFLLTASLFFFMGRPIPRKVIKENPRQTRTQNKKQNKKKTTNETIGPKLLGRI